MSYYKISMDEMDSLLVDEFGFSKVREGGCLEWIYYFQHPSTPRFGVKVYSSIDVRTSSARGNGKDALRCVYWDFDANRPCGSTKRIHRTETWANRLSNRLRVMAGVSAKLKRFMCPDCGSAMAKRKGPHGSFYGCLNYPVCRGTRTADEFDSPIKKLEEDAEKFLKEKNKWI